MVTAYDKPKWFDASLEIKESYDSNVFYSNETADNAPAATAVPIQSSLVTTVAPKIAFNAGDFGTFGLQVQLNWYESASTEDYGTYKFSHVWKGKADSISWNLDNSINIIDGNKETPVSNSSLSAYATSYPRDRREQVQYRFNDSMKVEFGDFYVQPNLSWTKNDLNTIRMKGHQNYINRYDFNLGVDVGYTISKQLTVGLGHRYGYQFADTVQYPGSPKQTRYCNNYHRILARIEATPISWMKISVLAGPDFRAYDRNKTDATFRDNSMNTAYWEGSLSLTPTKNDTITFTTKGWQWLSGSGGSSLFDYKYDLTYTRKLGSDLQVKVGVNSLGSDYDFPALRNDWQHTFLVGATYKISDNFSTGVEYGFSKGDNHYNVAARDYDRHLVTLSITGKL
ncbi:MAG: hypothetical protein SFY80_04195 [Verrucomicrobiota bacterium]|nr:hypothetical protein [Verrucomicrobiota bacterium]